MRLFAAGLLAGCLNAPTYGQEQTPAERVEKTGERQIQLDVATGKIDGTMDLPEGEGPFPVAIIIAGSGPTDRNGNQFLLKTDNLRLLGQGLAARGVAALRYDRRGIGKSVLVQLKEEEMRFEMLADDVVGWIKLLRNDGRFSRVAVVGHSEGSLVGMLAAKKGGADAFVAIAGCGRPAGEVLRWQLGKNLAGELREKSDQIVDELVAGRTVTDVPKALGPLFRPSVQPYLISYFRFDPAQEIARLEVPVLIVQGTTDLQTPFEEAEILAKALPNARFCLIEGMNHILKRATTPAEQKAAYTDPALPLAPELVEEVSTFLKKALPAE
jgi:hypothetical protein